MNGKYNKRSFVRKIGSMFSGLWIYVMLVKGVLFVWENWKYMFFVWIRFFFLGEVGLKEKFLILNMIDKKYFYYGIRKEWENKIVE